jgi:microcystin-dependent protein
MAWNVEYPINFTPGGEETAQAIYKFIQEINKIYEHLNALNQKSATPPQIVVSGVVSSVDDLPSTAAVGETWVVSGIYHIWDGQQWVAMESSSYEYATENTDGLVRLGTLNGVNSGNPSNVKVITEIILKTLLDSYTPPPSDGGEIPSYEYATESTDGLVRLGTLNGVNSGTPSNTKVITEIILKTLLDSYTPPPSDGGSVNDNMPHGAVVMWYGMVSAIPSGWVLCDGTNGTPDMRGRFPRGAPTSTSTSGAKGGADSLTLKIENMPAHTHTFTGTPHTHTFTGTSHTHTFTGLSHSHIIGSHSHSQPTHTHSIGSHTHTVSMTAGSAGSHSHSLDNSRKAMTTAAATHHAITVMNYVSADMLVAAISKSTSGSTWYGAYNTSSAGAHTHSVSGNTGSASGTTGSGGGDSTGAATPTCSDVAATGTVMSASPSGTVGNATATAAIGSAGSGTAIDNRPAYCELIFIMKL